MSISLIPEFQTPRVRELRAKVASALGEYHNGSSTPQVIVFAAPTGAGKTIMMTALIEDILCGNETYPGQPNAIFVWLSDSPQLNEQSRQKIEQKSSKIREGQCVTIEDVSFDQRVLDDGHIYFLNTQKLGKGSNLAKKEKREKRNFTIWQTLDNTAKKKSDRLYFIIDEAHRGAQEENDIKEATTIMQRFLKGYKEVNLDPMPVVIGMSATPERFEELARGTTSTLRKCVITKEEVRESGLLKKRVVVTYQEDNAVGNEMAILQAAADDWKEKWDHWARYCEEQHKPDVNPVFVIQVQSGKGGKISDTDLDVCLQKIEERTGFHFDAGEVVHTFGQTSSSSIAVNGLEVPYEEPSRISDNKRIKVVFFKENLSTGWDCPRAETMMSFRRAVDATYIAQLLGRMVRTPMGRAIETDDVLNDVHLYLPYFDEATVEKILDVLKKEVPVPPETGKFDTLTICAPGPLRRFNSEEILKFINEEAGLRSYRGELARKTDNPLKSLFKMAHFLSQQGLAPEIVEKITSEIVQRIHDYVEKLKKKGEYKKLISEKRQFRLKIQKFDAFGGHDDTDPEPTPTPLLESTDEDINTKFKAADRRLGSEGIGKKYCKSFPEAPDQRLLKIDVILFAVDEKCLGELDKYAKGEFCDLNDKYRSEVTKLPDDEARARYDKIVSEGAPGVGHSFQLPKTIVVSHNGGKEYSDHLFVEEETGTAQIKLNSWEEATIKEEQKREDFVCWIRNVPNAPWALAIPYDYTPGDRKLVYPDFIIVRKDKSQGYVIDILEPHDDGNDDFYGKVRGFAKYAQENPSIGRLQMIYLEKFNRKDLKRLDLAKIRVRKAVLGTATAGELNQIIEDLEE